MPTDDDTDKQSDRSRSRTDHDQRPFADASR